MANLCIKTPSSASLVLIFQLLVLRPRPSVDGHTITLKMQTIKQYLWDVYKLPCPNNMQKSKRTRLNLKKLKLLKKCETNAKDCQKL